MKLIGGPGLSTIAILVGIAMFLTPCHSEEEKDAASAQVNVTQAGNSTGTGSSSSPMEKSLARKKRDIMIMMDPMAGTDQINCRYPSRRCYENCPYPQTCWCRAGAVPQLRHCDYKRPGG